MARKRPTPREPELLQRVRPALDPGECLLWVGRPNPRREARAGWIASPVGLLLAGICLHSLLNTPVSRWTILVGHGLLIALGVAIALVPVLMYWLARGTIYVITERRVIIVETGRSVTVHSCAEVDVKELRLTMRPDGSGTLAFAHWEWWDEKGERRRREIRFIGIPEVREVERLLRETFRVPAE